MTRARGALAAALGAALALASCERTPDDRVFAPIQSGSTPGASASKPPAKPRETRRTPTNPAPSKSPTRPPAASNAPSKSAAAPPAHKASLIEVPPATYREIATAYNQRTARLQRVWGRAVVSVEYTDDEGRRRSEQGEGHFQVIQPSRLALSAGKLGEVILWIGCDADRYWFIDAKEHHRAWVGRHASATREKVESLGMPAPPRELLALAGITALPAPGLDARRDPVVRWGPNRKVLVFEVMRGGSRWRYTVDPRTHEPSRIEVIDGATGEPILSATLQLYENVTIRGEGYVPPKIASRIRCLHHPSGSNLGLSIADMVDGGGNKLREENFDFEALRERLGITEVVDADAPRPAPVEAARAVE